MKKSLVLLCGLLIIFIIFVIVVIVILNRKNLDTTPELVSQKAMTVDGVISEDKPNNQFTISAKLNDVIKQGNKIVGKVNFNNTEISIVFFEQDYSSLVINHQNHPYIFAQANEIIEPQQLTSLNNAYDELKQLKDKNLFIKFNTKIYNSKDKEYVNCNKKLLDQLRKKNTDSLNCSPLSWEINFLDENL